ncbi:type II secretion system protein GspL [Marinobacter sp. CHS3-4]|uniref:type II secretion system protein GspL n=1 Tax=Marinobacter sp. CHS3-4 TaxID=3045174 RepID=UPI0024B5E556|nr:type II secretion system protein GspL [Marinobacter sp. CHS3-4]MDI9245300.1 type II secretion system protein GspL [Marinobacter sp. CHS3-4]
MSYRLYVRPTAPFQGPDADLAEQRFNWALLDASGDSQAHGSGDSRETIEQTLAQNDLKGVRLIGLIPGEEALFCLADIPAKQSRFIQQALPFAVEEQIAQDIESVHLALGPHTENGYQVAAIDHRQMGHWIELFSGWSHAVLEAIYPDASLLPITDNGWSICLDGDTAMMANDQGEWLSVQSRNLGMFVQTLSAPPSEEVVAEVPVTLFATENEFDHSQADIGLLKGAARLAVKEQVLELMPLELLAHAHHHHLCAPINLCQGGYSIRRKKTGVFGVWKPLVAVASVWFILQVAVEIGFGYYHSERAEQVQEQAMGIYREFFPNDRRTTAGNVRRVVQGQLNQLQERGTDAGFIALMKYTGSEYTKLAGADSVVFNSVNYSQNRGELVVDVRADSYGKLSALRNGLSDKGLEAQIGSVVNEADGARGRLTVSGG